MGTPGAQIAADRLPAIPAGKQGQDHDRWRRVRHRPRGRSAIMRRNSGHRLRDCHYGAHTKRFRRATMTHLYGRKLLLV